MSESIEARIAGLLARGYSVDRISEMGITDGWRRADVMRVIRENKWALDFTGRLHPDVLRRLAFVAVPLTVKTPNLGDLSVDELVDIGLDHAVMAVRLVAERVQRAVEDLRLEIAHADVEAARVLQARHRSAPQSPPSARGQDQKGSRV